MHTICKLQGEKPVYRFKTKPLISFCRNETTQVTIFSIDNKNVLTFKRTYIPVFHNNINIFMYFPQQRLLQCFLFRIRSHICLLNNATNTRRTQSTLPPTECKICVTFDPFRTFHPSLHVSVALF